MTKIKNTKKGMAKKTLSMSLVVAMLATSNVPVWAAEFSDGTDANTVAEAFTAEAEAPVVEEEETIEVATETTTNDNFTADVTINGVTDNKVVWNEYTKVSATIRNIIPAEGVSISTLEPYAAWKIDGNSRAEERYAFEDYGTISVPELTGEDAGKKLTLYIYVKDYTTGKTVWSYTSDEIAIEAIDYNAQMNAIGFADGFELTYDGKEKTITKENIKWADDTLKEYFDIAVSGDTTNVTDEGITVTITPNVAGYVGTKTLNCQIKPMVLDGTDELISDHFEATLKTTNFTYTGNVIRVKASDVTLIDKDTKADLSGYLYADEKGYVSLKDTDVQETGETTFTLNLIEGQPETGIKNYKIAAADANSTTDKDGYRTIKTTNKATVSARDLSAVTVSINAQTIPADGKLTLTEKDVTFKDSTTNETLNLWNSVDVTVDAEKITAKGSYDVTVKAKANQENVTGKTSAKVSVVAASIAGAKFTGTGVTADEEYTGSEITKTAKQLGSLELDGKVIDSSEYDVTYKNNVNAGTATIIVKGKNSFEGSEATFTFTINPAKVTDTNVTAETKVEYVEDNKAADYKDVMGIVVKAKNANGKEFTLVEDTDYTVKYSFKNDAKNEIGTTVVATITITNKNFKGEGTAFTKEATITASKIKAENIKLKETNFTYTGNAITPDFDIVIDGHVINPAYYTAKYTNNINAGTATLTVKGDEDHYSTASTSITFEIKPADASTLVGTIASEAYRGYSIEIPADEIDLKLGSNTVDVASNFKLTYGENLNIGEGTVTLTPKNGNFTGTKTLTFDIVGKLLNEGTITTYDENGILTETSFEYDGTAHTYAKAIAEIKDGNKVLAEGTDYDLVYVDNVYGKKVRSTNRNDNDNGKSLRGYEQRGAILAVAKGTYGGNLTDANNGVVKGVYTDDAGNKITNVIAIKTFEIIPIWVDFSAITVKNATYAGGLTTEPTISIYANGKTLVEGDDYTVKVDGDDLVNATTGKPNWVEIEFINGYTGDIYDTYWGIDKFDLANADVTVEDGKVTVKCGRVDVESSEYTVEQADGKVTVTAAKDSKNYTGSKTVSAVTEDQKPGAPMISSVKVVGNTATVILSGESDGATGYDYVIASDRDCINTKDYDAVNKNQIKTETTFNYVGQGTYYAYCHAWKRDENGQKVFSDWSNAYPFVVSAITPSQPTITSVKANGSTVTVTYTASENADGYDVVLGTSSKKVNGETRPVEYGTLVKKNVKGNVVTVTFKNVEAGTYYAGLHAFNRTSEDGKKVFSQWSNVKKVTVK